VILYGCPSCGHVGPGLFHDCDAWYHLSLTGIKVKREDDKPDGKHVLILREDYAGPDGALAAISTVRPDGSNDLTVLAMPARAHLGGELASVGAGIAAHPATVRGQSRMYRRRLRDPELEVMARLAERYDLRMAWSAGGVFAYAMLLLAQKAGQALNSDSYKCAVYSSNTMTPDRTVATAPLTQYNGSGSQWVTANENSGSGYTSGGSAMTGMSLAQAGNVVTLSASNLTWGPPATVTGYGDLVYDTTVSNDGLCFNYFGGVQTVTAGTFTVSWPSGVATFTT
jgi:hypothetical protein